MSYLAMAKKAEARLKGEIQADQLNELRIERIGDNVGPDLDLAGYYPEEILLLQNRTLEELAEIHRAKLTYPCQRIIQEGPEKPQDRAHQSNL